MIGRYKTYPEYKKSGIEWVGDIPKTWEVKPTFAVFDSSAVKNVDGKEDVVLSLSYGNIIERDVENNFGLLPESFNTYQIVNEGDLILRLTDLQNDKKSLRVGQAKQRGIITSAYLKLQSTMLIDPRFAYRLLHSYDTTKVFYGMGGGLRQSMKFEDFRRLPIVLPSIEEQQKIADFLDHETAQIDTLISKQEKLIELLEEKLQAVISHAVTKGLNPDAIMKDSGVEWLGEVPNNWEVAIVRRFLLEHRQGYYTTDSYIDDGIKLLRITDLRGLGEISSINCPKVPNHSSLPNYYLKEGDVVFARTGGAGSFGVIPKLQETLAYASYLIRFRFIPEHFNTDYLRFMLVADSFQLAVKRNIHGGVNQNIHAEDIKDTYVCCPSLNEQEQISNYLNYVCEKYEALTKKAISAIELMRKRKVALISATVTGKIDVSDWQVK